MVTWFYFIVFLFSLILTGSFMLRNKNVDTVFVLFSILITINCMGRYMLAAAQNLEMALWANRFLYFGGCYAPLLTVIVLAKLCNKKMPTALLAIMVTFSTVILSLVMTIGKFDIYYKSVEIVFGHGYNYLNKTYGPIHVLYPILMISYAVIMAYYLIYALRHRKQISFRTVITISVTGFAVIVMYIMERLLGSDISFLAVGYLFGIMLLIKYFERINMYDMSANIATSVEKLKEYGYIVFDDKGRYVNANDLVRNLFPEIRQWIVDKEVPVSDSYVYRELVQYFKQYDINHPQEKYITVNDCYYQVNIRQLSYGKKAGVGYLIELVDRTSEKKYYNAVEAYNANLEKEVARQTEHIMHIKDMMVLGMADMVESRDNNTGGHIKRTSDVIKVFANRLEHYCEKFGFDHNFLSMIAKAAPMHDLGKIAVDDVVLRKPGKYTEEEYNEMKKHPSVGAGIVENLLRGIEDDEFVEIAKNIALYHHEKWNGQGYPMGLAGTRIPIEARVMALADVFDALVSKRCYKDAFSYDKAMEIIRESMGEHFDPELGKIFLECRPELEQLYNSYD